MAAACMMRQNDEKHIIGNASTEILLWSSRRDLIAVSNSSGEVFLRRLSWSKVWKLSKRGDNIKVTAIIWRPDSEILAVGYSSGHVVLVNVEAGDIVHTFNPCELAVTCLSWESSPLKLKCQTTDSILPKLVPLPSRVHSIMLDNIIVDEEKKMKQESELSVLWIGIDDGTVYGYVFGLFPCCVLQLSESTGEKLGPVRQICPNADHSRLSILADHPDRQEVILMNVETCLIADCDKELNILATLYQQISGLTDYLASAQKSLKEAWEDALVDLESKMARYDCSDAEGSLSVDLIELLMFGHAGIKLESFLVNDLTDKGLKRIGQAVELSYSNMQKLLVKHVMCANNHLCNSLAQLCGLARQEDRFSILGLRVSSCILAYQAAGSFTAKTAELLQVIEGSLKYLKTFFRWLYVTILRLSDEPIQPELATSTQQDVRFIANFLAKDFENNGKVRLDRVGQYLRNENLTVIADMKNRPWDLLVEACPLLTKMEDNELFPPISEASLVQQLEFLENAIGAAFHEIPSSVGQSAPPTSHLAISLQFPASKVVRPVKITSRFLTECKDSCFLMAVTESQVPSKGFYIFEVSGKGNCKSRAAYFYFGKCAQLADALLVADIQFYNSEILSVLLSSDSHANKGHSVFLQLSVNLIREELLSVPWRTAGSVSNADMFVPCALNQNNVRSVDASTYAETASLRMFPDFRASSFGLSSTRKVAAIFSEAKRKIRIFDMEVDDEEELDEEDQVTDQDTCNISQESAREDKENDSRHNDTDMAISP